MRRKISGYWKLASAVAACAMPGAAALANYSAANTFDLGSSTQTTSITEGNGIAGVMVVGSQGGVAGTTPAMWNTASGSHNYNLSTGSGNATDGFNVVGTSSNSATLWTFGTTSSSTTILSTTTIPGVTYSAATALMGNQIVGYAQAPLFGGQAHATLWNGPAGTAIDLNPSTLGFTYSRATGTSGAKQVGVANWGPGGPNYYHGILWSGTANSAIDLTPPGYAGSTAYAISPDGTQQAGSVTQTTATHAAIFAGSAGSLIDINPSGYSSSLAFGTNGRQQVGYAVGSDGYRHPGVWSGSASGFVDLTSLLPSGSGLNSGDAYSIDAWGNISGVGGFNWGSFGGALTTHAMVWYAGDVWKNISGGSWTSSTSWTSGVPTSGSDVEVIANYGISTQVTATSSTITFGNLTVDATSNAAMTLLKNSGTTLTTANDFVGIAGNGTIQQTIGKHVVGTLTLGQNPGSNGTYSLSGSSTLAADTVVINSGSFNQTGGSVTIGTLQINSGSYNQYSGSFTATSIINNDGLNVGTGTLPPISGTGATTVFASATATATTMTQGSVVVNGRLTLTGSGNYPINAFTNTGSTVFSGGTLTTNTFYNSGIFNQTSGFVSVSNLINYNSFSAIDANLGAVTGDPTTTSSFGVVGNTTAVSVTQHATTVGTGASLTITGNSTNVISNLTNNGMTSIPYASLIYVTGNGQLTISGSASATAVTQGAVTLNGPLTLSAGTSSLGIVSGIGSLTLNKLATATAATIAIDSAIVNGSLILSGSGTDSLNSLTVVSTGKVNQISGSFSAATVVNNGSFTASNASLGSATGSGSLTVPVGGSASANSVSQNALTVNGILAINKNGTNSAVTVLNSLTVGASGKLDLADNDLILNYSGTSPVGNIRSPLVSGFNGGSWMGNGISSSAAAGDTDYHTALAYAEASQLGIANGGTFDGQTIPGQAVVVKYTYYGDNDLDGKVTLNDFSIFVDGFNGLGTGWVYGDYNYDGLIEMNDLTMFVDVYTHQGSALSLRNAIMSDPELSLAQKQAMLSVVPEPTSFFVLPAAMALLAGRRRTRRA